VAPCQYNFNTLGKTRVAPKKSKTTTARWLAWKTDLPLAMKRQINNEETEIFPNSNMDLLRKPVQLRSFTFLQCTICIQDHFNPW